MSLLPTPTGHNALGKRLKWIPINGNNDNTRNVTIHNWQGQGIAGGRPQAMAQGVLVKKGQELVDKKWGWLESRQRAMAAIRRLY